MRRLAVELAIIGAMIAGIAACAVATPSVSNANYTLCNTAGCGDPINSIQVK